MVAVLKGIPFHLLAPCSFFPFYLRVPNLFLRCCILGFRPSCPFGAVTWRAVVGRLGRSADWPGLHGWGSPPPLASWRFLPCLAVVLCIYSTHSSQSWSRLIHDDHSFVLLLASIKSTRFLKAKVRCETTFRAGQLSSVTKDTSYSYVYLPLSTPG